MLTFSSRALWCSKRDLRALRTSTSEDTPPVVAACRLTTVILSDLSCRATRHSRCSKRSCKKLEKNPENEKTNKQTTKRKTSVNPFQSNVIFNTCSVIYVSVCNQERQYIKSPQLLKHTLPLSPCYLKPMNQFILLCQWEELTWLEYKIAQIVH